MPTASSFRAGSSTGGMLPAGGPGSTMSGWGAIFRTRAGLVLRTAFFVDFFFRDFFFKVFFLATVFFLAAAAFFIDFFFAVFLAAFRGAGFFFLLFSMEWSP